MNLFSSMKTLSTPVFIATLVAALLLALGATGAVGLAPAVVGVGVTGVGLLFYLFFTGVSQMPTLGGTKKFPEAQLGDKERRGIELNPEPMEVTKDPLPEDTPHRSILMREENGVESIQKLLFIEDEIERNTFANELEDLYLIGPKRAGAIRDWIYSAPEFS